MTAGDGDGVVEQLLAALRLLAGGADEQRRHLEELGVEPLADELALELDDVLPAAKRVLNPDAQEALLALSRALDALNGRAEFWTVEALQSAPEWEEIRELARRAEARVAGSTES